MMMMAIMMIDCDGHVDIKNDDDDDYYDYLINLNSINHLSTIN